MLLNRCAVVAVEERIAEIKNAAEDAIASLKNAMKTKMVRLPKAVRSFVLVGWLLIASLSLSFGTWGG